MKIEEETGFQNSCDRSSEKPIGERKIQVTRDFGTDRDFLYDGGLRRGVRGNAKTGGAVERSEPLNAGGRWDNGRTN